MSSVSRNYIDAFTKAKNVKALKVTFTYAFMTVPLEADFRAVHRLHPQFQRSRAWGFVPHGVLCALHSGRLGRHRGALKKRCLQERRRGEHDTDHARALNPSTFWRIKTGRCSSSACCACGSSFRRWCCSSRRSKGVPEDLYEAASIDGATKGPPVPLHHHSADFPGDLLQPGDAARAGVSGVQRPVHHHQRRPAQRATLISVIVYNTAFKDYKVGHVLRDGVGHVRDRDDPDHHRVRQPEKWVYYSDDDGEGAKR